MSEAKDKKNRLDQAQPPLESEGEGTAAPRGDAAEHAAALLQRELDECKSRLLRSTADYQNMVRRSQQSVQEAREQQLLEVTRGLINVLDHFDRALAIDLSKVPAQNLLQGVQIVRDELNKLLEGFGIRRIEAKVGEEFNPTRHEALMHQSVEGVPADRVASQLSPGYSLGERTLRPAKVSIAK